MSDLFDSLKKNKEKTTGKKRNTRDLSPVKFPFSDDEDSDDVVLKIPQNSPGKNGKFTMSPQTKRLLKLMKKCVVKLPKDKDGRLLQKIHAEWKKTRKNKKKGKSQFNKYPIVKIKKTFTISKPVRSTPKQQQQQKSPENNRKSVAKTPEPNKKATPAKVYVKFPLSTPNSNKKKKTYAKTPLKKVQKPKPRGHDIASKRLNATPALVREFGKKFFMSYVGIQDQDLLKMIKNPKIRVSPPKKKKFNNSVTFNETVEYFGSESEEDESDEPIMPVSLVTALNGSFTSSTPKPKGKKENSVEKKKKPILTPAAKKNYKLADEKKVNLSAEAEEEEDDDAEYIVPTEISPPKKQPTPPPQTAEKSPSPEKENTSSMPLETETEPEHEPEPVPGPIEIESDHEDEPEVIAIEPAVEISEDEPEKEELAAEVVAPIVEIHDDDEEPKNNSNGNDGDDFENDEDSQGQNIVQDFISRTVQDLAHDDSEDIQDDEELVDEKRNSSPSALNDDDNESVSNKITKMCQTLKSKMFEGSSEDQPEPEAMETDNA